LNDRPRSPPTPRCAENQARIDLVTESRRISAKGALS
jgi:hypothetical protein